MGSNVTENMLGGYGEWAARTMREPARLSFRQQEFDNLETWRRAARTRFRELLLGPDLAEIPIATEQRRSQFDGLSVERLLWQLPYGPPTEVVVLKPADAKGRLPGIIALHDHAENKYFGWRKIARVSGDPHPAMLRHQEEYYGGVAWANELARRGYLVVVHDAFTFGSRRMRLVDLTPELRDGLAEAGVETENEIQQYNKFAAQHEHVIAKSLFSAGMTWPGVFVSDDQRAVDYLVSRADVDPDRIGCCGLSGGGLRTVMLAAADERIRCSCCVGMMTTWRDYLLNKSHTHTWMCYVPGLPRELDYPEVLGLTAPNPALVLNNREDSLFTFAEMERASRILTEVYEKAGLPERFRASFYDGPHKFDLEMQKEAFDWFDHWLKDELI